jgi:hypothetical protein
MKRTFIKTVAGISTALAFTGVAWTAGPASLASAAPATAVPAKAPTWHQVGMTPAVAGAVYAVVATGKTTGWAFTGGPLAAYQRTGPTTWRKVAFPAPHGQIYAAGASSPSNVWAIDNTPFGSQALRWNGSKWSVMKNFSGWTAGVSVLGTNDVWAFGGLYGQGVTGVWHYNGHAWTRLATTLDGGYARTDQDVWAFTGTKIAHFNGAKWTATDLAKLLPPKQGTLIGPHLTAVIALSAGDVYALGIGNNRHYGGPLVVLHYNGHAWTKVASGTYGTGQQQVSADGKGGLWIPAFNADDSPVLLHYYAGKLTAVKLPGGPPQPPNVVSISRIPGTAGQIAGGYIHAADSTAKLYTLVLQYS